MPPRPVDPMSPLEFHVLLALAGGPLYGYAVAEAVADESQGALHPRAGTLYRIIARLTTQGYVRSAGAAGADSPHPGLERKYYALTAAGRRALAVEAQRLKQSAAIAVKRLNEATGR